MEDHPLTISKNTIDENTVILAAWERLARIEALSFTAQPGTNSRTGWAGSGHARVRCERNGRALRFLERGRFTPAGSDRTLVFNNIYCWRLGDNVLSLSHERFGREHPVHLFDLVADGDRQLTSASPHLCGADRYHGRLVLMDHGFILNWRIRGPAKDERLVYRYFSNDQRFHNSHE